MAKLKGIDTLKTPPGEAFLEDASDELQENKWQYERGWAQEVPEVGRIGESTASCFQPNYCLLSCIDQSATIHTQDVESQRIV